MTRTHFPLHEAVKLELDAVYGALALIESAHRSGWRPDHVETDPWSPAYRALFMLLATQKDANYDQIKERLSERMFSLQERLDVAEPLELADM